MLLVVIKFLQIDVEIFLSLDIQTLVYSVILGNPVRLTRFKNKRIHAGYPLKGEENHQSATARLQSSHTGKH